MKECFNLLREPEVTARYNIKPSQLILTFSAETGEREAKYRRWGLVPSWSKSVKDAGNLTIACSETVNEKPSFRTAIRKRRCLIPASGFYEWEKIDKWTKQPWHYFPRSGELMAIAGIWEQWTDPEENVVESCAILTTGPNEFMAPYHDRLPVFIPRESFASWLDPDMTDAKRLTVLYQPCPDEWLTRERASMKLNGDEDSPECLVPSPAQKALF